MIRQTTVSNEISWFEGGKDWAGLRTFVQIEQQTMTAQGTAKEERFYISNLEADAVDFTRFTRGH